MRQALQECDVMVALYSPAYSAEGSYALAELDARLARPQQAAGLVPLRVAECEVPDLYRPYLWADLSVWPTRWRGRVCCAPSPRCRPGRPYGRGPPPRTPGPASRARCCPRCGPSRPATPTSPAGMTC
ncbi:MAG: toll/interleukin-1 receptor domain-containing protein [Firmicutes bacterium]|nr:toll/interleukin-1 receptor domain-containing protein [Bacillota bacterium]